VLEFETGKLAKQAGGAVTVRSGDTVVLGVATMSATPRDIDFFPLTCDYEERMYSVGKIPGGFFKREGKPSERAVLTSRLIDRPTRPLFPDGMRNDVQVVTMPLSVDQNNPPDMVAMLAASAALTLSDIPWEGPTGAVRVGLIDGEFVLNPSREQLETSDLDLVVAGTHEAILMVEAGANQVPEEKILEAMRFAHEAIQQITAFLSEWQKAVGKEKREPAIKKVDPEILAAVRERAADIRGAIYSPDKAQREGALSDLKKEVIAGLLERFPDRGSELGDAVEKVAKQELRAMILEEGKRPDGRGLEDIRQITCEVGILPRAHGSGLFTRGQTQVLSVATLGGTSEDQMIDGLGEEENKTYMHHYNFPPYSVGEVRPMRGPGRREVGHGALAERALEPVLPDKETFPYVIRVVSDTLESNGSTSMASTCGSTLSLMDAGVPLKAPVSGIAMGLMTEGDKYAVLSDIQGMEDFGGDMDFKVTGTETGVTAIQMDTKIGGIPWPVLEDALAQARRGRMFIMGKMLEAINAPRAELSVHAPRIMTIDINPEKIGAVIGPGGAMIKKITGTTGASVDIQQDGRVLIGGSSGQQVREAIGMIKALTDEVEVGSEFRGKVTRIMGRGAMVEYLPGREGMVPKDHLTVKDIRRIEDVVNIGDELNVKVFEVDNMGRINLTALGVAQDLPTLEENATATPPPPGSRSDGGRDRGDRGGRGRDRGGRGDRGDRGPRPDRNDRPMRSERPESRTEAAPAVPSSFPKREKAAEDDNVNARFRPRR
jgi:polyribonucleotide nucleotidyltransferase